jgi:hypothetical protein
MMWCMDFRLLFACRHDARGHSDLYVLSSRRRVLVKVICANLCARASNFQYQKPKFASRYRTQEDLGFCLVARAIPPL